MITQVVRLKEFIELRICCKFGFLCCSLFSCTAIEKGHLEKKHQEETINLLNETAMALRAYEIEESQAAEFLGNLTPKYLVLPPNDNHPGVPVDAWGNPVKYSRVSRCLTSAGPDQHFETDDDIIVLVKTSRNN